MNNIKKFSSRKEVTEFLKEKGINTLNWSEEKWQSINNSKAEIHIQALAEAMWDAMNESTPKQLKAGEWHIPFEDKIDGNLLIKSSENTQIGKISNIISSKLKIATARCARLSYNNHNGEIDYQKDIELHDRLLALHHMSPMENFARAMSNEEYYSFIKGKYPVIIEDNGEIVNCELYPQSYGLGKHDYLYGWCNNFRGFIPYRYLIENEKI